MISIAGISIKFVQTTVILFLLLLYYMSFDNRMQFPFATDFVKLYASAQSISEGKDPYQAIPVASFGPLPEGVTVTQPTLHPNLNIPLVAALFLPLTHFSYGTAYIIWSTLSLFFGIAAILLVAKKSYLTPVHFSRAVWLVCLLFSYYPAWITARTGQVSFILFFLAAVGWVAARERRDTAAGTSLGLAMLLKPFFLIFIPFFLVSRRWRLAAWSIAVFSIGIASSLILFGLDTNLNYVEAIGSITWYSANWNASLIGFFTGVFGGSENTPLIEAPRLGAILAICASVALMAALLRYTWRAGPDAKETHFDALFGLTLAIMLLSAPLGWMYYFPILFIPLFALSEKAKTQGWNFFKWCLLLAFAMQCLPIPLVQAPSLDTRGEIIGWGAIYFYSLVVFAAALLAHLAVELKKKH